MADINTIRSIIGICGNVISFGLFLSPLPTFLTIIKKKDTEQFSPIPYLATLLNCLLWCFYGMPFVKPNSLLVITINGVGLIIESVYLAIFLIYAPSKGRMRAINILVAELIFFVAAVAIIMTFAHTPEKRATIVGILAIIFNIGMYASPLSVMKLVIETKSVQYLPIGLSVASFFNGSCWFTYGLLPFDINIAFPNGLGVLSSLVQLILIAMYYKSTPKSSKEVEMQNGV